MNILKYFRSIRKKHSGQKIVFCSGTFDLPHAGHVIFFEDCKKYGDILVVTVGSDNAVRHAKGPNRPILNEHVRLKIISGLRTVDYAVIEGDIRNNNLLAHLERTFASLKPDLYVINEDAFDILYRKNLARQYNIPLKILKRSAPPHLRGISTSAIIAKIKSLE